MAAPTPTTEPTILLAGDTAKWLRTLPDYPAGDGWVLSYQVTNAAEQFTLASTASGDSHLVTIAAGTSSGYEPGDYDWRARVSLAGEVYTVGSGRFTIRAAFDDVIDGRSKLRQALEAIEATLSGRATSATAEYQIAGRSLKYIPLSELVMLRDRYRIDVAREDAAAQVGRGLPDRRRVLVRFGP